MDLKCSIVRDANQISSRAKFRAPIGNIDSKKFFFYIILLKSSTLYALEFEGETRRSMQVSSGNSKISSKNCLSIFPFYNLRFIPRSKEQRGNKNWKILGAHRQSFDRGPLLPTFSPAACVESRAGKVFFSSQPSKNSLPRSRVVEKFCLLTYTRVLSFASLLSYIFPAQFCVSNW